MHNLQVFEWNYTEVLKLFELKQKTHQNKTLHDTLIFFTKSFLIFFSLLFQNFVFSATREAS